MSHTTTLKNVAIRDVEALHKAVAELKAAGVNCDLAENARPRMYYSNQGQQCEYVLQLHDGQYDVGLAKQGDGSYSPVMDTWGGHVGGQVGADVNVCPMPGTQEGKAQHAIGKFMQSYSKHAAINSVVSQGFSVESTNTDADGNIHVTVGVE